MTSRSDDRTRAYVWTWLPGSSVPVVAGVVAARGGTLLHFAYADSYLDRPEAISLYRPELPLRSGWQEPLAGMSMPSSLRDGSPDTWGRRVIMSRVVGEIGPDSNLDDLSEMTYMLESGTDRFGAIDFQESPTKWVPREDAGSLDELTSAAELVMAGEPLTGALGDALVHGTSIGGARPKVLLKDGSTEYIAKLSNTADPHPVVKAEALALELARRAGLNVPNSFVTQSLGRDVLVIERFDRTTEGGRRHVVSGLTMAGAGEMGGRHVTYLDLLDVLRLLGRSGEDPGRELFQRIAMNIAIGNIDDHARNHAAFWDGKGLSLTPAYDLCPQVRSGETAAQALAYGSKGERESNFATLISAAASYGLSNQEAREVVEALVGTINDDFADAAELAQLTKVERKLLWGRQILNAGTLYGLATA